MFPSYLNKLIGCLLHLNFNSQSQLFFKFHWTEPFINQDIPSGPQTLPNKKQDCSQFSSKSFFFQVYFYVDNIFVLLTLIWNNMWKNLSCLYQALSAALGNLCKCISWAYNHLTHSIKKNKLSAIIFSPS